MPRSQNPTAFPANSYLLKRIEGRWILRILLCLNSSSSPPKAWMKT
jgi:hypothetical protein